jgi:hypothetical protein
MYFKICTVSTLFAKKKFLSQFYMMLMVQMHLFTNTGFYNSTPLTRILIPRFLGKKSGEGLQQSSVVFFLEEVDPRHHEASFPSFLIVA